jgi:hypothetical protein
VRSTPDAPYGGAPAPPEGCVRIVSWNHRGASRGRPSSAARPRRAWSGPGGRMAPLSAPEPRGTLLADGREALAEVLRREGAAAHRPRRLLDQLPRRPVHDGVDDRPGPLHRERRGRGDRRRDLAGGRPQVPGLRDLVDQADPHRLVRVDRAPREEQAARPGRAHHRDEPAQAVGRVDHADPGGGHQKAGPTCRDAPVARDRQLKRPAHRRAVQHRDHRAGTRRDRPGRPAEAALPVLQAGDELLRGAVPQVEAAREVPVTRPAEQHDSGGGRAGALQ